jgi:hypothetical protein
VWRTWSTLSGNRSKKLLPYAQKSGHFHYGPPLFVGGRSVSLCYARNRKVFERLIVFSKIPSRPV